MLKSLCAVLFLYPLFTEGGGGGGGRGGNVLESLSISPCVWILSGWYFLTSQSFVAKLGMIVRHCEPE